MPDKNKIILGTNDDTYIAADDAGNIILQNERGVRVQVDNEGIKASVNGGAMEAIGGGGDLSAISQSIIPDTNEAYDLGTAEKKFRDLYLSSNSLYVGNTKITSDPSTGTLSTTTFDENGNPQAPSVVGVGNYQNTIGLDTPEGIDSSVYTPNRGSRAEIKYVSWLNSQSWATQNLAISSWHYAYPLMEYMTSDNLNGPSYCEALLYCSIDMPTQISSFPTLFSYHEQKIAIKYYGVQSSFDESPMFPGRIVTETIDGSYKIVRGEALDMPFTFGISPLSPSPLANLFHGSAEIIFENNPTDGPPYPSNYPVDSMRVNWGIKFLN